MEQKYKEDYEEVQCIGRGNFGKSTHLLIISFEILNVIFGDVGAAYLVRHRQENVKYIAKKVMLSGLK